MQSSSVGEKTLSVCALESPLDSLFGDDTFADVEIVAHEDEDDDDDDDDDDEGGEDGGREDEGDGDSKNANNGNNSRASSRSFAAHRAVLAACSPYFRSMFSSGFAESQLGRGGGGGGGTGKDAVFGNDNCKRNTGTTTTRSAVEIRGVSPASLELLLRFCYSGRLSAVPRSQLLPLASLADRLDVPALRSAVDAAIDADLGPATVAEYAAAAAAMRDLGGGGGSGGFGSSGFLGCCCDGVEEEEGAMNNSHNSSSGNNAREALLDRCLDALCAEFAAAAAQPAFLSLTEETLGSVLEREDLVASSEAEVFDAVCRWAAQAGGASGIERPSSHSSPPSFSSSSRLAENAFPPPPPPPPSPAPPAFERLCRRVRFGSMDPSDLAAAAAHPLSKGSAIVQGMVLRAFVHIHAPRKPADVGGGDGGGGTLRGGGARAAATTAAMMEEDLSARRQQQQYHLFGHGRIATAPPVHANASLPPLSPETPPLLAEEEEEAAAAAAAAAAAGERGRGQGRQQQHHHHHQRRRHQKNTPFSSSSPSSFTMHHHHIHIHQHPLDAFGGDSVSLPPRGGAGARLRLRVVVADGGCSWPADPAAPPCPPGRHCGCPPPTAGAPPRGLSLTVPRDWSVLLLKKRACRDLGLDPRSFALFDFYNGQKYGRGPLCDAFAGGGGGNGDGGNGEGGGEAGDAAVETSTAAPVLTCGGADLRDGQLVLLELIRR